MVLAILGFGIVITQQAWLNDDSFITLRVVSNFHEGYGLRWNIAERVQVYTHPLWMFLLTIATFITQEYIYTTLIVSILIGVASFALMWRLTDKVSLLVVASLILITSQSYRDYSSSGLENPLSHLLITIFIYNYIFHKNSKYYILYLGLLVSFILLNRLDLLLIILPLILWELWQQRSKRTILLFIIGFSPFIFWEVFSVIYYGFPVPNTAYSKINPSSSEPRFYNGLRYYLFSIRYDAITLIGILLGLITSYITRNSLHRLLSIGILLYLSYWIYVGGDYMGGRSFSVVLCVAMLIFITSNIEFNPRQISLMIAFIIIFFNVNSVLYATGGSIDSYVTNERDYYKQGLALSFLNHTGEIANIESQYYTTEVKTETVFEYSAIGVLGFFGGSKLHVIDTIGLGDALIARLPPLYKPYPRPGHFYRGIPEGYIETWETNINQIEDPDLARFYDHLTTVTQGPIWSWERWKTIWKMNIGAYDHLIDQDLYTFYHLYQLPAIAAQTLEQPIETPNGIQVNFDEIRYDSYAQVQLDSTSSWRIIWYQGTMPVGEHEINADGYPHAQVYTHQLNTPPEAQQQGFDTIRLLVEHRPSSFLGVNTFLFQGLISTNQLSELEPMLELSAGWLSREPYQVAPQINFVSEAFFEIWVPITQTIQLAFTPIKLENYPTSSTSEAGTMIVTNEYYTTTIPITVQQEIILSMPLPAGTHQLKASFDGMLPSYDVIQASKEFFYTRAYLTRIRLLK